MRVLVSGGSGVLGRAAVRRLLARGHAVRLLARGASEAVRGFAGPVEPWPADLATGAGVRGAAEGCDAVLHLAGLVHEAPPGQTFHALNVEGTRRLVDEAARAGARRFVYVSSLGAERGRSAYHRSKRAGEHAVRRFPGEWLVLRPGNVYGPGDQVISLMLKALRTAPVLPVPRGRWRVQPLWVGDLAEALARAVEPGAPSGVELDLAGPEVVTIDEVLDHLEAITGRRPPRLRLPLLILQAGVAAVQRLGMPIPITADQWRMLREENVLPPGRPNALSGVFGVAPVPLAVGLRRLAQQLPEKPPQEGRGPMHRQRYWAWVERPRCGPAEAIALLRQRFAKLTDTAMEIGADPGGGVATLAPGRTLTLTLPLRGHVQVRVLECMAERVTCVTLKGHPLAGLIRFEARAVGDALRLAVRSYSRAGSLPNRIALRTAGRWVQRRAWRHLVHELARACGQDAPVHFAERRVPERWAAWVERWAATAIQALHRSGSV